MPKKPASQKINLSLHPKQAEVFNSKARFRIVASGRRWGKCLAHGTRIAMSDGTYKEVQDVLPGDMVLTFNEETYKLESKRVQHVMDNGVKETVVVKTKYGKELTCTPNHPIYANKEWIEAGQLQQDDLVATPKPTTLETNNNDFIEGDIRWEPVKSVDVGDLKQTYDLTIEDNHNFISNGIFTHNTRLSVVEIIRAAKKKNQKVWYVCPSYRMARDIVWNMLLDTIPKQWVVKKHDTRMEINLINGTQVACRGADDPEALRGVGLDFVVLDEVQDIDPDAWYLVLRPTLADRNGRALFIGSPKPTRLIKELYDRAPGLPGWERWQFKTIDSPFIPEVEIEQARRDMDELQFAQEFLGQFVSKSGRVYHAFTAEKHISDCPFNPNLEIWVGQDFNISPMAAVICQPQPSGEVWVVDEIVRYNSNTIDACDRLEAKYWRYMDRITIFPDSSSRNRQHARGESDLDIFRQRGFTKIRYRKFNPPISDRVNAVNAMLENAEGEVRLKIDRKCRNLIASLEQVLYKDDSREINKKMNIEHCSDSLGYIIHMLYPVAPRVLTGTSY